MKFLEKIFPLERFSFFDYLFGSLVIIFCFVSFRHSDVIATIWASFGFYLTDWTNIYEYYLGHRGGINPYNPSMYIVFAIWFLPHYFLGLISDPPAIPSGAVFWMWAKVLCVVAYCLSAILLHRLAFYISKDKVWARYAALLWLIAPFALFSQFIFSGYDVFYTLLTILGVHKFLQKRIYQASLLFGIAITFKTFPTFVFLPLLFLYEKRLWMLGAQFLIFYAPSLFYRICYSSSQAYYDGVLSFPVLEKVFGPAIHITNWNIITLPFVFALLCCSAYFTEVSEKNQIKTTLWIWLFGSLFPFFIIGWHPQWLMFMCPAIAVTTMMCRKQSAFLLLDICGFLFFIALTVSKFRGNVDEVMFVGAMQLLGFKNGVVPMSDFFIRSFMTSDMYSTCFQAYLVLVVALKYKELCLSEPLNVIERHIDVRHLRMYFYTGILIFVIPACWSVYKTKGAFHIVNVAHQQLFPPGQALSNRSIQQTFIPEQDMTLESVELFLATYARNNTCLVYLDILDADGRRQGRVVKPASEIKDNSWCRFTFDSIALSIGMEYTLSLSSNSQDERNAVTWWSSRVDTFPDGNLLYGDKPLAECDGLFKIHGKNQFLSTVCAKLGI